jgi:hypothetical protein
MTRRSGAWWLPSVLTFIGFSSFIVYATWAGVQNANYVAGENQQYLSPFYAPEIFGESPHAWFPKPAWWPSWMLFTPAMFILWAPAGFRTTCYYYRGAYYKAFWADPPACAVGEPRKSYLGENAFPLILQNVHRYFLYVAIVFIGLLSWDVWVATRFSDGFGIGVGTLVLATNVTLIAGYTFGCHAFRHLVGGRRKTLPRGLGKNCYDCVSGLNRRHMLWAWCSLFSVGFADFYVRMCAMGIWTDFRII